METRRHDDPCGSPARSTWWDSAGRCWYLEAAGVVDRPAPGVYGLTDEGTALEPVLVALGRWGRRRPLEQQGPMSPDALFLALRTTFDPAAAGDLDVEIDLRVGDDRVAVTIVDRTLTMARGQGKLPTTARCPSATAPS